MPSEARFAVGQRVHHKLFDYRGVVYDVDPVFAGTEEWYQQVARSRPPRDRPWYHVIVDGASHTTYVADRHLEADPSGAPIASPLVAEVFEASYQVQTPYLCTYVCAHACVCEGLCCKTSAKAAAGRRTRSFSVVTSVARCLVAISTSSRQSFEV